MGNITVKFIGKEYSIPEDVLTYIELLDFTNSIQTQLKNSFVRKLRNELDKGNVGCLDDEIMAPDIEQQTGKFIAKLTNYGIFDRTINDYLCKNEGYKLISKVNASALAEAKRALNQQMSDWLQGYEDAVQKKDASVTGLGFSIWSGSFVNHAIYAAMEASKVNAQEKAAAKEYQRDMAELDARLESRKSEEEKRYIANTYIPNMEAAITVFAYELLDTYISDLIKNGKMDKDTLKYINIDRSNDLLKNLTLSSNKEEILYRAFEACPYNLQVYSRALNYGLLDYESYKTAEYFKQEKNIIFSLVSNLGDLEYPKKFKINYDVAEKMAEFTQSDVVTILQAKTKEYVSALITAYQNAFELITNKEQCFKILRGLSESSLLAGEVISSSTAQAQVNSIVTVSTWNQLVNQCGYIDLLEKIKAFLPPDVQLQTKSEIDDFLIKKITINFEEARQKLLVIIKNRNEENEKRAKEEADRKEIEKQKRKRYIKLFATIMPIIIVIICVFVCLFKFLIIPSGHYKSAVEMYNQGKYEKAIDIFQTMQDYKDSHEYIVNCYMFLGDYKSAIAYNDTKNNKEIVIPNGIARIKADAFCNAENITSVVIPDSVTVIESNAFMGCDSLTRVTIPSSITHIENGAFDNCDSLVDVHISDLVKWCHIEFEDLTSSPMHYGDNLYLNGELLTEIDIPDNLTKINEYTFASWDCLISVSIGDNIIEIDSRAFSFCDNLKKVILPNTITNIKESTFNNCNSLVNITIPSKVKDIGENAFNDCNSLTNVIIPNNVENIGKSAFANCDNLTEFSFPDGIKTISAFMFYPSNSLTVVKIPNSVKRIEEWAFRECSKLSTIEFAGTINEWRAIEKDEEWDVETDGYTICCTDGEISASQNALLECKVGDIITFGSYEQDGNSSNGAEDIEWVVLERKGNRALVISQYCIERKSFNDTFSSVLWENCTLRNWLNKSFLNTAFSDNEQTKIISSNISTDGRNTTDKVFLLSEDEATKYFETDYDRKTDATEHLSTSDCYWLLRNTGSVSNVAYVDADGTVGYYENVDRNWWVRPAMWIDISE